MTDTPRIVVAGAGSIGCFVGGLLLAGGRDVVFLGRESMATQLRTEGVSLTDYDGLDIRIDPQYLDIGEGPAKLAGADIVLVCVKSGATSEMADMIAEHVAPSAVVVSLQNGMRNAEVLREHLPSFDVLAGMVPFNVVQTGPGTFHRGTSGNIVVEAGYPDLSAFLSVFGLKVETSSEIERVQWGKLLINLNNALNALSGLTIVDQLANQRLRRQFADQMAEALRVMKAANISPKPSTPLPASLIPHVLRLPTFLFRLVARQMLTIDPTARTSMAIDILQGRKTEIDELQGEIIRLGEATGVPTPISQVVLQEIRKLEAAF